MRMPAGKLCSHAVDDILQRKQIGVLCHVSMKNHLHQNIAQLFFHAFTIMIIDSFQKFINFFDHIAADTTMSLFTVPGTAAGRTQFAHDFRQRQQIGVITKFITVAIKIIIVVKAQLFFFAQNIDMLHNRLLLCRNEHTGQMIDLRLPVQLIQLDRPALFIRQPQITQKIQLRFIVKHFHQIDFHIGRNQLTIDLRNHQRILTGTCQCFKIVGVYDAQTGDRINSQIDISQIQKAHCRQNF